MGGLIDISRSAGAFGKGKDITKDPNFNYKINASSSMELQFASNIIGSLFNVVGLAASAGGGASKSTNPAGSAGSGQACQELNEKIQGILDKYGCGSVEELEIKYHDETEKKVKREKNKKEYTDSLKTNAQKMVDNNNIVIQCMLKNNNLSSEIGFLRTELEREEKQEPKNETKIAEINSKIKEKQGEISTNQNKIDEATAELNKLDADRKVLNGKLENLKNYKVNGKDTFDQFNNDVETLKQAVQNLKRIEGRNAVEQFQNDDAKSITKLLKELRTEPDNEKQKEIEKKLIKALENYYKSHKKGENKTLDALAQNYKINVTAK